MSSPQVYIFTVYDSTTGAPKTGVSCTFDTYVDETGTALAQPTITEVGGGRYAFFPTLTYGHGIGFIVNPGSGVTPSRLSGFIRPEDFILNVPIASPQIIVWAVFDGGTGAPKTGVSCTFASYTDETGASVTAPAIVEIGGGLYKFQPTFTSGHDVVYVVDTASNSPQHLSNYVRAEDFAYGIPSVATSLVDMELPLASATLSGGAQLIAASGSLPNRITTQNDVVIDNPFSPYGGVMFDLTDPSKLWLSQWTPAGATQFNATTGIATGVVAAATNAMGCQAFDSSHFYLADYGANLVREFSWSGTQTASMPVTSPMSIARVPGTSGKIWVIAYSGGNAVEYAFPSGTPTGRSVSGSFNLLQAATGLIYLIDAGTGIRSYDEPTLTLQKTWAPNTDGSSWPGHIFAGSIPNFIVVAGQPIMADHYHWNIDRLIANPGAATGAALVDKRLVYAQPQLGGAGLESSQWPSLATAGNLFAFVTGVDGDAIAVRIKNLFGTQRARWSWTNHGTANATIMRVTVPGALCNDQGATYDLRKTRSYYSLDGGTTRTEFTSGSTLGAIVPLGFTLTIDVDVVEGSGQATNQPYIGGMAGEGLHVVYDNGQIVPSPSTSTLVGPSVSVAQNTTAIFGSDSYCVWDPPLISVPVTGNQLVGQRILHRLSTPRGALACIGDDPSFGWDLRQLVNAKIGPSSITVYQAQIQAECVKDEEVSAAVATITFADSGALTVSILLTTADGPFTMVIGVDALTVALLDTF